MTEYQKIFRTTFAVGKTVRDTNGNRGKIIEVNWERNYVLVSWHAGETRKLNINKEHVYIIS